MTDSFTVKLLVTIFLAGLFACGNNQDQTADNTTVTGSAADVPASVGTDTVNTAQGSGMTAGGNMGMSGMNMNGMSGMTGGEDADVSPDDMSVAHMTDQGMYRVSINPELDPIPINRIHSWTLHLENAAGDPVNDAEIFISGGMPIHNHGLPTAPRVSRSAGDGDYRIEGVQFQMPGRWIVSLDISAAGKSDTIDYDLVLQP